MSEIRTGEENSEMAQTNSQAAGPQWTREQLRAITAEGSDILVAAAAGSGKTAVLVERIIRRISDEERPLDVDRLLVATFTKAAADEMRQRIREALEQKLREQPDSRHLRRQLALLPRASITTLHSFCLDVIRQHVQVLGLDPSFRVAAETETDLLREEAMDEIFERCYAESEPESDFWRLVETYSGDRSDRPLFELVARLYDFSRSHPDPDLWLQTMTDAFLHVREPAWLKHLQKDVRLELEGVLSLLEEALAIAGEPAGPAPYIPQLERESELVRQAVHAAEHGSWEDLHAAVHRISFDRLASCRGEEYDKRKQERAKDLRDRAKDAFQAVKEECFGRTPQQFAEENLRLHPLIRALVGLVQNFAALYEAAKRKRNVVDYADLEHYCLRLLRDPNEPGRLVPSDIALEYRERFHEVLIDEYQDTNMTQEAILELLSRPSPGNRFMVGDVKQSIYRFRLAEPSLFLRKYRSFGSDPARADGGLRIDLAQNFRSRRPVIDAVNFVFRQIMSEQVGEMAYDDQAALRFGAAYYPELPDEDEGAVELLLLDRAEANRDDGIGAGGDRADAHHAEADPMAGAEDQPGSAGDELEELETAQLEARQIAARIRRWMGEDGRPFLVWDKQLKSMRPVQFRDIVILLRATHHWAPVFLEELRLAGIPAYGESSTGYFSAVEVDTVLSLLKIIDNPYQDIPLAAVLRSPICRITENELAEIRIFCRREPFYTAVRRYAEAEDGTEPKLREKLAAFLRQLERWRVEARHTGVSELIWRLYRMTGYFEFVGGLPGGAQRQANLRALYDRARQFESTSFRGLFRFLRFIERIRDSGGDLGVAGAIGEQEDVVRIMSIHKSKGLEFPVVFVAGLGKRFNRQDLNRPFLLHRELGFGPKIFDPDLRVSYPSLAHIAIRRRLNLEMLAEEMRVLYVALTRAREKLVLVGTFRDAAKEMLRWSEAASRTELGLPDALLAGARCYLDWIGPALARHPDGSGAFRAAVGMPGESGPEESGPGVSESGEGEASGAAILDPSRWRVLLASGREWREAAPARAARDETIMKALYRAEPLFHLHSDRTDELEDRFRWVYPHAQASRWFSKTSVSELKRRTLMEPEADQEELPVPADSVRPERRSRLLRRPRFLGDGKLAPTEKGILYHAVMQHVPLDLRPDGREAAAAIDRLAQEGKIPRHLAGEVDPESIAAFFRTPLISRLRQARDVRRELPFSFGLPASELYPDAREAAAGETIIVQGVIDCLFAEEDGYVLLDYKTDAIDGVSVTVETIRRRYETQIRWYARAVEGILRRPVKEAYLYLFSAGSLVRMI